MRSVMLLNFLVNLFLLLGTLQLGKARGTWYSTVGAAALGAAYAGSCMLPGFAFLGAAPWRVVSLGLMSALAFGINPRGWKLGGLFSLQEMALGGIALASGKADSGTVLFATLLVRLLGTAALGQKRGGRLLKVEIAGNGKKVSLTALEDTGNGLRDPVTGEPVLVIGAEAARTLTGLTPAQLGDPLGTMTKVPGLRLVPYRAVGVEHGMLLAMRFPVVRIAGEERPGVVAFAPQSFTERYQALAGGIL